jgi:hypothetical protein
MRSLPGLVLGATLLSTLPFGHGGCALAQAQTCSKADFEAVVDEAAASLRELTHRNTPPFQAKLRQLKDKRGWSHDQFLTEAAPLVRDETIAAFDAKAEGYLARINAMGQQSSASKEPDCALLPELRAAMSALVETQKAKWTYMFEKVERELRR